MTRPIALSLSPNTEKEDISRAWYAFRHPEICKNESILEDIEGKLAIYFNQRAVLTSSGRNALASILTAYEIGEGHEVLLQAFTCVAVPAAIQWAKAKPVYVDISPQNFNLDPADFVRKINSHTRAVIIQHTFGIPADIEKIIAFARERHILVIEDCAHALGATYNTNPVGTFGDISFLSFGRDKCLSCVFGGAVISKDHNTIKKIRSVQSKYDTPPASWVRQQLFHPLAFSVLVPLYFSAGGLGKAGIVILQKLNLLSKAVEEKERIGKMPHHFRYRFSPALGYLLTHQLDKLNRYTERRRQIAEEYTKALKSIPHLTLPTVALSANPSWLRFPVLTTKPDNVRKIAREYKLLLGDWYDAPLAPSNADPKAFGYNLGMCPHAEATAERVINLPTYPLLSDHQVQDVIEFIKANA